MNRREFNQSIGWLSLASLLPLGACTASSNSRYKMGLQLFSVNEDMKRDPEGTLKAVKAMGYEDFEIYGFDPDKLTYYGIPAREFKKMLDDMGLSVTSGHYGFSDLLNGPETTLEGYVESCIIGAEALNSAYITWPWVNEADRTIEGYKRLAACLNRVGRQVTDAGLAFAYHNHGYEWEDLGHTNGYEIILAETDPDLVKLQMDMYWVMWAGRTTPKELVQRQPGRFVMWHIKDMHKVSRDYTELGNGSIDYHDILPDPEASGLEYFYIEQGGNFTNSPLESAGSSAAYFQSELQQHF